MNKTELWNKVQEILVANKANKALTEELELLLSVKTRSVTKQVPKYAEDGTTILELYCDYTERYHDVSEFTLSKGHKFGYSYNSKIAKLEMKKYNDKLKSLTKNTADSVNLLLDNEISMEELQAIKSSNEELTSKYTLARNKKALFADTVEELE